MSALDTAVMRLWLAHESHPREFAAVMRRFAAKAERAARMLEPNEGEAEPFLATLRAMDEEVGQ